MKLKNVDDRKFIINNKFGDCIDDKGNIIYVETPFVGYFDYDIEVIGNIHDNPELLEVK